LVVGKRGCQEFGLSFMENLLKLMVSIMTVSITLPNVPMQTIKLRSRTAPDGTITLQLPAEVADQDLELILIYQPTQTPSAAPETDALIGLFAGSQNLATEAEKILEENIQPQTGLTWKQS
jgi:hypothetical protein